MKRLWTAQAVILCVIGVLAGCNDYNNSVQYDTGATLTNLSPSGMPSGATPNPSSTIQCPGTAAGQNNPCFTLYVIASSTNPFSNSTGVPSPVVQWNGTKLTTTFIDTTNLSAQVPYSYLAKPGTVSVNTYQPTGQGTGYNGLSNSLTFTIYGSPNPYPTLSSVAPTSAPYCDSSSAKCANVSLTVAGTNFLQTSNNGGSQVTLTGASTYNEETAITVNSISSDGKTMTATIPGTLLCASGPVGVNVINPPAAICLVSCPNLGGGDTNAPPAGQSATTQTFTITNPTVANTCPPNVPPGTTTTAERPAISQDGRYVAYASAQNGTKQILVRDTCLGATGPCTASTATVSAAPDGTAGNADSHSVSMTPDGRYVAFSSAATNLAANAPVGQQIYVRDTCHGATGSCKPATQVVSVDAAGKLAGLASVFPAISANGRFVAFVAETPSVVASAANTASASLTPGSALRQIFVRDTCLGATNCTASTTRVSALPGSAAANAAQLTGLVAEDAPAISQDGRYVAYTGSQNGSWQILVSDRCQGAAKNCVASTKAVSIASDSMPGNGASHNAVMTPDGRYVVFSSAATNLIESAPTGRQVYLRDTCAGVNGICEPTTILVSTDEQGQLAGTEGILPSISGAGRYVAFLAVTTSQSGSGTTTNSGLRQVFVRDTCVGAANCEPQATRISLQPGDVPTGGTNPAGPALAALAKQVALPDGRSSTLFTSTVAVDDRVLVAIPNQNN
jgi:TolB protein